MWSFGVVYSLGKLFLNLYLVSFLYIFQKEIFVQLATEIQQSCADNWLDESFKKAKKVDVNLDEESFLKKVMIYYNSDNNSF